MHDDDTGNAAADDGVDDFDSFLFVFTNESVARKLILPRRYFCSLVLSIFSSPR